MREGDRPRQETALLAKRRGGLGRDNAKKPQNKRKSDPGTKLSAVTKKGVTLLC